MLHLRVKPKILQPVQRQPRAKIPNRIAQRGPGPAGGFEQAYFVFREEDEIAVRICSETAFFCRRAETSERFQSSLVIVLKSGALVRAREDAALDAGGFSGEGIAHESAMPERRFRRREKQRKDAGRRGRRERLGREEDSGRRENLKDGKTQKRAVRK